MPKESIVAICGSFVENLLEIDLQMKLRIERASRRKTNPQIWQSTYLLNLAISSSLQNIISNRLPKGCVAEVLDVGCGEMPYREFFDGRCSSYVGCDYYSSNEEIITCPADNLTFTDRSFDLVVCIQVLEHVHEPWRVLEECFRVLRPGGTLLLTAPFMFPYHASPKDYFRYSKDGLRYLAERAGFQVEELINQCGTAPTLVLLINVHFGYLANALRTKRWLRPLGNLINGVFIMPINLFGLLLSSISFERIFSKGHPAPSNYLMVAKRKDIPTG